MVSRVDTLALQQRATYLQAMRLTCNAFLLFFVAACPLPDDDTTTEIGTTEASTSTTLSASETSSTPTEMATSTDPSTSSTGEPDLTTGDASTGSTVVVPVCGDGQVDGDEECDGGFDCNAGDCRLDNVVFMSGASFHADELGGGIGGLKGADDACQLLADAGGLPGRYKAWLSTVRSSPARRFVPVGSRYVLLTQQQVVAHSWDLLLTGEGSFGIDEDAVGNVYEDPAFIRVWTATGPDGRLAGSDTCNDWTSNAPGLIAVHGLSGSHTAPDWTAWQTRLNPHATCNEQLPIYCFKQGEVCGARACVAARAGCEDTGSPKSCLDGVCADDPCGACEAALTLCDANDAPCPITRELCAEMEDCGCA